VGFIDTMIIEIWPQVDNNNSSSHSQSLTISNLINNFPFTSQRYDQTTVLNQICAAFNSGYKYIILEAPTGFGKSPVAIAVARTLGSSYICTSTKDLQTQYSIILRQQKERITLLVW
jgi:superfamily II DNA or RNA helicase